MSLREQDKVEDRQESFSFSNYDFSSSSSAGVVLSDGEDSDESYIEIELEQAKSYRTAGDVQSDGEDGEIELRISISSHTPFPQLSVPSFSHVTDAAESGSSQSSSSANYASTTCFWSKAHNDNKKVIKSEGFTGGRKGAVQFPAVSRLLSMLISSLKVPPENCQENNVACSHEEQDKKTEMSCARKPTSKTRTTMKGGIMNFFIKLRTMQGKALLAPIMNTRDASATTTDRKGKKRTSGRERKQKKEETLGFYRRTSTGKSAKNSSVAASSSARKDQCYSKSSSVNNKKIVTGVLNGGRFERKSSSASCPSSIRCSPLHAGENSIQAAIAHCKSSFAPFPGFSF